MYHCGPTLERYRSSGSDNNVLANGSLLIGTDCYELIGTYLYGLIGTDFAGAVGADFFGLVDADFHRLVVADFGLAVDADDLGLVVLHDRVHVVLAVDADLFFAGGVVEDQFVVALAFVRARLDAALGFVFREGERRHLFVVVDAADDDGAVGIAFLERDDDLLADARDLDHTPVLAGPGRGNADPAGTAEVVFPFAVPVELDFDAAVLVGPDFLARWADDDGGLGAVDRRFLGQLLRAVREIERDAGELVRVRERSGAFRAIVVQPRDVLDGGEDIRTVGVEVSFEVEAMAADELSAVAFATHDESGDRLLFHADARGALIVLKDFLQVLRTLAAGRVDAVKTLRVLAGVVVLFQIRIHRQLEGVHHLAHLDRVLNRPSGFKVPVRQLEGVVPQRELAGAQLLDFLPLVDAILGTLATNDWFEQQVVGNRQIRMALRCIGQNQLVSLLGVPEEVVDAFLFHQSAGEIEVAFVVLHAVVAQLERPLDFVGDVESRQHFLENVGHGNLLEDAALNVVRQQPQLWHHFHAIGREGRIASGLSDSTANAVDVPRCLVVVRQADRDALAQEFLKRHRRAVERQHLQLVAEEPRHFFFAFHVHEQEAILAQRGADRHRPPILGVQLLRCCTELFGETTVCQRERPTRGRRGSRACNRTEGGCQAMGFIRDFVCFGLHRWL